MSESPGGKLFTAPNIAIGLVVEVLGSMVFAGMAGPILFFASIVCTAGVSLLIWIPLAAELGAFVMAFSRSEKSEASQRPDLAASRTLVARDYIEQADSRGWKRDDTLARLKENGWTDTEITNAIATMAPAR